MDRPLVTVVMPAYNAEAFISAAIDSVLGQSYQPIELVVVDDGSTDGTAAAVHRFGQRLSYVYQQNFRQGAARNRGARAGRGQLLAFIDADDVWSPQKVEKQVALWQSAPEAGLVLCGVEEIDGSGRVTARRAPWFRGAPSDAILLGQVGGGICGSTFLVSREVFQAVGGFDETLTPCEDTDLFWRVASRYPIRFVDEPLVRYRLHASNAHADLRQMHDAWRRFYDKALRARETRARGRLFAARCRGRLNYMLAGDNARAGALLPSLLYAGKALIWWPPAGVQILARLAAHAVSPR